MLPAEVPEGVRPTAAKVREALFSMVGQQLAGWSALDLCGGSGLVGIEAASRGAAPVWIVERDRAALAAIRRNVAGLPSAIRVVAGDARSVPLEPADLVYLDPPYRDPVEGWLLRASALTRRVLVVEARRREDFPPAPEGFTLDRVRHYGEASLGLYERVGAGAVAAPADEVLEDAPVIEADGGG